MKNTVTYVLTSCISFFIFPLCVLSQANAAKVATTGLVAQDSAAYIEMLNVLQSHFHSRGQTQPDLKGKATLMNFDDQKSELPETISVKASPTDLNTQFQTVCAPRGASLNHFIWTLSVDKSLKLHFVCEDEKGSESRKAFTFEFMTNGVLNSSSLRNDDLLMLVEEGALKNLDIAENLGPVWSNEAKSVRMQLKTAAKGIAATLIGMKLASIIIDKMYPGRYGGRQAHALIPGAIAGSTTTLCLLFTEYEFTECVVAGSAVGIAANTYEELKDRHVYKKQGVYTSEVRKDGIHDFVSGIVGASSVAAAFVLTWSWSF